MERTQKTAVMTSSPKILSGRTRIQVPKLRVSAGEIAVVTPTRSPKKVKGRGKTKGQRQPLGLAKIKLPSDYTSRVRLYPKYIWKDGGASFPNKLLSRFKKYKGSCSLIRSVGKETQRLLRISTSTPADISNANDEAR